MREPLYENDGPAASMRVRLLKRLTEDGKSAALSEAQPPDLVLSEDERRHILRLRSMNQQARDMLLILGETHARDFPADEAKVLRKSELRLVAKV